MLTVFVFRFYFVQFVGKARIRDLVCAVVEISPYESAGHARKEAVKKEKKRASSRSLTNTTTSQFQSRIKTNLAKQCSQQ